eukprot:1156705-Pelagomonas_calceolata.AAC.5
MFATHSPERTQGQPCLCSPLHNSHCTQCSCSLSCTQAAFTHTQHSLLGPCPSSQPIHPHSATTASKQPH